MKLLLDTHIFIWWDSEPHKLSPNTLTTLNDPANILVLSAASVWEMQIKSRIGKLTLRLPLNRLIGEQRRTNGLRVLAIRDTHVFALDALPLDPNHKDPFDRLLIAQAIAEQMELVSVDPYFKNYPVTVIP
jgi:PIN domain nuclease of toxin-antitoxin system